MAYHYGSSSGISTKDVDDVNHSGEVLSGSIYSNHLVFGFVWYSKMVNQFTNISIVFTNIARFLSFLEIPAQTKLHKIALINPNIYIFFGQLNLQTLQTPD